MVKILSGIAIVVPQHSAEPFVTLDLSASASSTIVVK